MKPNNLHLEQASQFFNRYKITLIIIFLSMPVIYQLIDFINLSEQEAQFTIEQMESSSKLGDIKLRRAEFESQRQLLAPYFTTHPSYLQLIILKELLSKSMAKSSIRLQNKTEYLIDETQLGYDISVKMVMTSSFQSVVNWIQSQFSNQYPKRVESLSFIKDGEGTLSVRLTMKFHYYLSTKI